MDRFRCVDLYCGDGGATDGFLAAGFEVTGVDVQHYPNYKGRLVQMDVRDIPDEMFTGYDVIWASPPCVDFSRWRMPWTRKRASEPNLALVQAAYRLRDAIKPHIFILENVREAQWWLGPAAARSGSYYFWGDVPALPELRLSKTKEAYAGHQAHLRARIPFNVAYSIACSCRGRLEAGAVDAAIASLQEAFPKPARAG